MTQETGSLRGVVKALLPKFLRDMLRACLHYVQRVGRWAIILWQVRGATWTDQWTLIRSAFASPISALRDPWKWQDPILLADAEVTVRAVGRFLLRARSDDLWHVLPWREQAILKAIASRLRPDDIFIDAGANIGIYTVVASRIVGPRGRVFAVEMMPETADRLRNHIHINDLQNVTVIRSALSDQRGKTVTATVAPGKFGQASIAKSGEGCDGLSTVSVMTTTLDDVAVDIGRVRLMKMDLEGAELSALIGAPDLLKRLEFLIYESWGVARSDNDAVDAHLLLAGFSLAPIDGNNCLGSKAACCV